MRLQDNSGKLLAVAALLAGLCMSAQAAGINADAVNELTPDAGVTVDGVTAQDGHVALPEATAPADTTGRFYNENGMFCWDGTQLGPSIGFQKVSEAYVAVDVTADAGTNGTNLLDAYAAAKAKTPFGAPLSATSRVVVLVPPGAYDLGGATLELDTDYVDLMGLSPVRENQRIYRDGDVLTQSTARYVHIGNLVLHYTGSSSSSRAYYPNVTWNDGEDHTGSPPGTVFRNCEFRVNASYLDSMRHSVEYAGVYEDCSAGGNSAFGAGGIASGTFTNCTGGNLAFAGESGFVLGIASGTFTNCTGGTGAFGGNEGTASGTFTHCTGGNYAFGGNEYDEDDGVASGTFTHCTGGEGAFGGSEGTASGSFSNCTGGDYAFGGDHGTASGTFTNCIGGGRAFGGAGTLSGSFSRCTGGNYAFGGLGGDASGGSFYHCIGGTDSFTTNGSPTVLYCVQDGAAYP